MRELIGVADLAEYLKVNKQTIYNWVSKREMPFMKVGDLLRFDRREIDRWLEKKSFSPDVFEYEGYRIHATPHQLAGSRKWAVYVQIEKDDGTQVVSRPFSTASSYANRDRAVKQCFVFGRNIIDGKVKKLSVEDM